MVEKMIKYYDDFCKICVDKVLCVPELRKGTSACPVYRFIQFVGVNDT